jgi:endonuclease-3 related protein
MDIPSQTTARLAELYRQLRRHFGYAHPWWPGNPFQITITAVLVQQCDWSVAWQGVLRLEALGIQGLPELADAPAETLREAIRKVTFAPTKSARLVSFARRVRDAGFDSFEQFLAPERGTTTVRQELLAQKGIGNETADCLLNFASEHPAFVVDAYTRRIFERLNLIPNLPAGFWRKATYAKVQQLLETQIVGDLSLYDEFAFPAEVPREVAVFRDYHALLVELGKHHCMKQKPHCRKIGKPGWPDYDHCRSHCLPQECTACPTVDACGFPMR